MKTLHNLYIIAGCNGAGKTTASYNLLPDILDCREFVNADEIAKGLSPFQPESVSIQAGRIMLKRINELIVQHKDFSIETTLTTRSYMRLIQRAKRAHYQVHLVYFWLESPELAQERVKHRVENGGHNIPPATIVRRYFAGIRNFINLFLPICDYVSLINNSRLPAEMIIEKNVNEEEPRIINTETWQYINNQI
ncbi:zeta toxin family protein [Gammaproteobacteria bacterium]|nr:zeta toxin family protein [Gammaproteobacteria bacterium]